MANSMILSRIWFRCVDEKFIIMNQQHCRLGIALNQLIQSLETLTFVYGSLLSQNKLATWGSIQCPVKSQHPGRV